LFRLANPPPAPPPPAEFVPVAPPPAPPAPSFYIITVTPDGTVKNRVPAVEKVWRTVWNNNGSIKNNTSTFFSKKIQSRFGNAILIF
jgi:hypothetical protein